MIDSIRALAGGVTSHPARGPSLRAARKNSMNSDITASALPASVRRRGALARAADLLSRPSRGLLLARSYRADAGVLPLRAERRAELARGDGQVPLRLVRLPRRGDGDAAFAPHRDRPAAPLAARPRGASVLRAGDFRTVSAFLFVYGWRAGGARSSRRRRWDGPTPICTSRSRSARRWRCCSCRSSRWTASAGFCAAFGRQAGLAIAFVLGCAAGTSFIGAFGVVSPLVVMVVGLMLLGIPIVDALSSAPSRRSCRVATCAASRAAGHGQWLDYLLLAIPFFILAAGLMNVGGITDQLVALAVSLVGHFRGGLGHVNVLTNTLMGGVSGSSTADAAAIAKTMVPAMEPRGYPKPFWVALTTSASILANMIPPSLGLIIYASLAAVSVGALFVGTIVPGLLMALTLSIVVHFECIRPASASGYRAAWGERGTAQVGAAGARVTAPYRRRDPLRRLLGDRSRRSGGALCVAVRRVRLSRANGRRCCRHRASAAETATVMIVIAASAPFAFALVIEQVPQQLAAGMARWPAVGSCCCW